MSAVLGMALLVDLECFAQVGRRVLVGADEAVPLLLGSDLRSAKPA
jgi:hypothetical protein